MKNLEVNSLGLMELDARELVELEGGSEEAVLFSFTLTGVLDKIKHNTECHLVLFGKKIF